MLQRAVTREVRIPGLTRARTLATYTIPEAAEALGRSESSFRRWLKEELLPMPILSETTRGTACYGADEVEIIAEELRAHESNFANLCASHVDVVIRISQRVHGLRDVEYSNNLTRMR